MKEKRIESIAEILLKDALVFMKKLKQLNHYPEYQKLHGKIEDVCNELNDITVRDVKNGTTIQDSFCS